VFEEYVKAKLFFCFEAQLMDRIALPLFVDDQHYFPSDRRKMFKMPLNSLYQLADVAEGLEASGSTVLHFSFRVAFKEFVNYPALVKHMAAPDCFPEALCRKMVRKTKAMAMNLNTEFNFTQNTARSGLSGLFGRGDLGFTGADGFQGPSFGFNRNSQAFQTMNGLNSMGFSNKLEFHPPQDRHSAFPLNSFQDINKYIHAEDPPVKKVDESKIKSLRPKPTAPVPYAPVVPSQGYFEASPLKDSRSRKPELIEKSSPEKLLEPKIDPKAPAKYTDELKTLYDKIEGLK
jgi:hypothetical protein